MNVHTFEVSRKISGDKFRDLAGKWFDQNQIESFMQGSSSSLVTKNAQEYGINEVAFKPVANEGLIVLSLVINPQSLIRRTATIDLFDCSQRAKERLYRAFDDEMSPVAFPPLSEWYIKRIDYAWDLHPCPVGGLNDADKIALYTDLLRKARRPAAYKDSGESSGSLHSKSKSANINFYNKQDQVERKLKHLSCYDRLHADALNILRIEIQCKRTKVETLKADYHLPDTKAGTMLQRRISHGTIQAYYSTLIGYDDFYSLAEAERRIDEEHIDEAKGVKVFLHMAAESSNLNEVFGQMHRSTYYRRISSCRQLGINPITIPERWGISHLGNPLTAQLRTQL